MFSQLQINTSIILIILFLGSCQEKVLTNEEIEAETEFSNIIPVDTIKINPSNKTFGFSNLSFFKSSIKKNEYLVNYNYNSYEPINNLEFYNIETGNIDFKLDLYRYTNMEINDFYVHTLDSIFIHCKDSNSIFIISTKNTTSTLIWSQDTTTLIDFDLTTHKFMRLSFNNNSFIIKRIDKSSNNKNKELIINKLFSQQNIFCRINNGNTLEYFATFPKDYLNFKNKNSLFHNHLSQSVQLNNDIVVSHNFEDNLYFYDNVTLKLKSKLDCSLPEIKLKSTRNALNNLNIDKDSLRRFAHTIGGIYSDLVKFNGSNYFYRVGYGNNWTTYILEINSDLEISNKYRFKWNNSIALKTPIPTTNGFILTLYKDYKTNPTFVRFKTH